MGGFKGLGDVFVDWCSVCVVCVGVTTGFWNCFFLIHSLPRHALEAHWHLELSRIIVSGEARNMYLIDNLRTPVLHHYIFFFLE